MSWYHHLTGYKIIRKGKSNSKVQRKIQRNLKEKQHGLPGGQTVGFIPLMAVQCRIQSGMVLYKHTTSQLIWGGSSSQTCTIPLDPAPEQWPREASWQPNPLQCVTLGCMSSTAALSPGCRTCLLQTPLSPDAEPASSSHHWAQAAEPAQLVRCQLQLNPPLQYPTALLLHGRTNSSLFSSVQLSPGKIQSLVQ